MPGGDRLTRTISNGFALSPSAAPFDRAKPWSTEWSDRLFAIEYAAPAMSEEAFSALAESIASALRAEGWELQPEDFDPPLYMVTIAGDRTWLRPTEAGGHPTQLVLGLSRSALGVTLGCGRADLMLAHVSEVFGDLPPGTPRPKVPEIPVPTPHGEAECDRPEVAAEMDRAIASGGLDGFMAALVARTTYRDRLTQWMTWKLEQSGKISREDLADLILTASGEASPGGNPFAQLTMLDELLEIVSALGEAEASGDRVALCRALVPAGEWYADVDALTLRQTEAAQASLAAEAVRLGVSLD